MSNVRVSKRVKVPAGRVWEVLSDYGNIYKFHPKVKASSILTGNDRGLGAKRRCEFHDKSSVVEEITEWEEGKGFSLVLSEISMPLKRAEASMRVAPLGSDASTVTISMDYDVKYGPMGRLMDLMMMRGMMRKMFSQLIEGLEEYALSGGEGEKGKAA